MPKNTPIRIIDSQRTRAVSFLGGSASTGGTTDHGLLLGLNDDDHAQYLRTDGTRTLTGNMLVSASVTIDGVDLSAHAADANAHHNQAHAITGSDHTVTGAQYQIVGLTGTNTIGLLTPSSSPGANAIVKTDGSSAVTLVDLTVSSDLFMTGTLDFGTDTITEDATYLQFAGSKAVKFNQNIGNANWTLYNAGGYTTTGSISITGAAGDLTVGSNVLFVDNSQANVGINMAPDSQFALDINGPARATYWIGPHALQLKGVLLLAHYDGRAPYAINFSGEPNGHMGQVATVAGGVIYRPGKFYKAAQISHATTNLVTNPRFGNASYLAGWTSYNTPTTAAAAQAYIGTTGAYVQTAGAGAIGFSLAGLTNGVTYTASVYVTSSSGTWPTPYMCNASFGSVVNATLQATTGDGWRRYVATATAGADGTLRFILPGTSSGVVYSNAQIEQRAFVTPYADGLLGDGHAWSGTAHASNSTRTAATLDYPVTGNISTGAGTIMAWVWVDANDAGTSTQTVYDAGTAYNYCSMYMASGTTPTAYIGGAGGTVVATGPAATIGTWAHVAVTWGGGAVTVYTNGVAGTPVAYSNAPTLHTSISVGYARNLGSRQLNGYIDDLCILDRAMPAAEVRSVYESNAPVFAETSTFTFRPTPKGLIWADDEGLWMRDTAGKPVLGVYGGEAATKNWGGFNLVPGDLLLGNNAVGSSAIWWSRVSGNFGFYGAGSGTPQVEIATDGSLTAGDTTLDSTGINTVIGASGISDTNSYRFSGTGVTTMGLYAYVDSGDQNLGVGNMSSNKDVITSVYASVSGYDASVKLSANGNAGQSQFNIYSSTAAGNKIEAIIDSILFIGGNQFGITFTTDPIGFSSTAASGYDFDKSIRTKTLYADGDDGGRASTVALTNAYTASVSTGTGTVKLDGTTSRNSSAWIKVYIGTTAYYLPAWNNIS